MLITRMIDNEIHQQLDTPFPQLIDECFYVLDGPVRFVNAAIVGNIISHVDLWGLVDWGQPDRVNVQGSEVVDF